MKTISRYSSPSGRATVSLVESRPVAQPMAINTTFAVVIDVKGHYASFDLFPNMISAAGVYLDTVEKVAAADGLIVAVEGL